MDHDSLRSLVRWQLASGSHGISLGGSTGEPSAQTVAERIAAMKVVSEEVGDRVPFLPGTGSAKLDETLEMTEAAMSTGCRRCAGDHARTTRDRRKRACSSGTQRWLATFPDMPIVLYNVPIRTAVDVAPETVARLRRAHDNIVGIKETTKDFEHFSRVFHLCGRDTLMWSGIELLCLPLLALGGIGFVSAVANLAPGAVANMYEYWVAGDNEKALDIHYGLHPLVDLMFVETNPAPIKSVLRRAGLIASEHVRPPLVPPTPPGVARIETLLVEGAPMLEAPLAALADSLRPA